MALFRGRRPPYEIEEISLAGLQSVLNHLEGREHLEDQGLPNANDLGVTHLLAAEAKVGKGILNSMNIFLV